MELAHLFEALMLVCFGFSWPLNVIKAYKARTAKGTSLAFIILIITGYVAGITAKVINHQFNYVLAVYFLNLAIVMCNIFVYIRNKSLDRKAKNKNILRMDSLKIENIEEDAMNLNYSNSLDEIINKTNDSIEKTNSVILMGGEFDKKIPVNELAKSFDFNFDIYNKSDANLCVENSTKYFKENIAQLYPEGILIHLGKDDVKSFSEDNTRFDNSYLNLLNEIKQNNKNCRIALISINNPDKDKNISAMNVHIKAIAESAKATFVNLESVKLWNPAATKAASEFAYAMGLRTRKPLKDVADILYSYAFNEFAEEDSHITLAG